LYDVLFIIAGGIFFLIVFTLHFIKPLSLSWNSNCRSIKITSKYLKLRSNLWIWMPIGLKSLKTIETSGRIEYHSRRFTRNFNQKIVPNRVVQIRIVKC
jgi:hypothetical protein